MRKTAKSFDLPGGCVIESNEDITMFTPDQMIPNIDPSLANYRTSAGDMWLVGGNTLNVTWTSPDGAAHECIYYCNEGKLFTMSGAMFGVPELPYTADTDRGRIEFGSNKRIVIL
ncbi:hypothetical protein [Alicyclobacillus sp. SO9]|uniref:hypothetical protein n=1 Tax=Alicyclobacillus sp. SO9 TaxID=2665646 RepID=UPI0018E79D93|nr:hypothetical protein [Alicyclobacillus sp. SO9]QQE81534.1 hypothetical protein GI364_24860 [Alicyclobacillus sp. SO9]